jgi:hypothetical protein
MQQRNDNKENKNKEKMDLRAKARPWAHKVRAEQALRGEG